MSNVRVITGLLCDEPSGSWVSLEDYKFIERDLGTLLKTFNHTHVSNGEDDTCNECGLDLRNPIHRRKEES